MFTLSLALVLAATAQDDKEAEKAAADALEQFHKAFKGTDQERTAAIDELAKVQHPKVASKLGGVLTSLTSTPVRVAAAKALGGFTEHKKSATTALANAIPANAKEPGVINLIFESIGKLQDPSAVPLLARYYEEKDLALARFALFATGKVGSPTAIDALIGVLARNEKAAKTTSGSIGVAANNPNQNGGVIVQGGGSNSARDRAQSLVAGANQALQEITKEQLTTADAWTAWWSKNKATFKK